PSYPSSGRRSAGAALQPRTPTSTAGTHSASTTGRWEGSSSGPVAGGSSSSTPRTRCASGTPSPARDWSSSVSGSTSRAPKLSFSSGGALELAHVPIAVLAGGLATRLGALAATTPKALVEVAGQPFVDHQLVLWQRHGLRRVVVCVGHLGEQIVR